MTQTHRSEIQYSAAVEVMSNTSRSSPSVRNRTRHVSAKTDRGYYRYWTMMCCAFYFSDSEVRRGRRRAMWPTTWEKKFPMGDLGIWLVPGPVQAQPGVVRRTRSEETFCNGVKTNPCQITILARSADKGHAYEGLAAYVNVTGASRNSGIIPTASNPLTHAISDHPGTMSSDIWSPHARCLSSRHCYKPRLPPWLPDYYLTDLRANKAQSLIKYGLASLHLKARHIKGFLNLDIVSGSAWNWLCGYERAYGYGVYYYARWSAFSTRSGQRSTRAWPWGVHKHEGTCRARRTISLCQRDFTFEHDSNALGPELFCPQRPLCSDVGSYKLYDCSMGGCSPLWYGLSRKSTLSIPLIYVQARCWVSHVQVLLA